MAFLGKSPARQRDLVFDFGFHRGEDTGYYLAMGQRVVAVDASAELIEAGRERFAAQLASGQLTLVHGALIGSEQRADTTELLFYPNPHRSEWGSVDLRWVCRNAEAHGLPHAEPVRVRALCLEELVQCYGCPQFLKIDMRVLMLRFWLIWRDYLLGLSTSAGRLGRNPSRVSYSNIGSCKSWVMEDSVWCSRLILSINLLLHSVLAVRYGSLSQDVQE